MQIISFYYIIFLVFTATNDVEFSISSEFTVDGINPDNFDDFQEDLTNAVAESLGVYPSAVTLTLEEPEESRLVSDRQGAPEYVVKATVETIGIVDKERIMTSIKKPEFKTDLNTKIDKRPKLKTAAIHLKKRALPIAKFRRGLYI